METTPGDTQSKGTPNEPSARIRRPSARAFLAVIVILVLVAAAYWWLFKRNIVNTDNAYAKADSAQVSTRIFGTVIRVLVDNDFPVEVGQPLLELDPADYRVAVAKAQAVLAEDEADIQALDVGVSQVDSQTSAQVQAAEASLKAAQDKEREARHKLAELDSRRMAVLADLAQNRRDVQRFENLYNQGAGTGRQQEQARTQMKRTQAEQGATDAQIAATKASLAAITQDVDRAKAQLRSAKSQRDNVEVQKHKLESLKARLQKDKAELEAAKLNLSYCTIHAPISGYIAQKSTQVGDRVQPGQAMMAVVPLQEIYVEANFKETQLKNVRIGQPATIRADIYPNHTYQGRVVGIRAGTGAAFSLLPPENATGNWIKVVQRVPVKVVLDALPPPEFPLRVGLSLEVSLNTANRSGPMLMQEKTARVLSSSPIPQQDM